MHWSVRVRQCRQQTVNLIYYDNVMKESGDSPQGGERCNTTHHHRFQHHHDGNGITITITVIIIIIIIIIIVIIIIIMIIIIIIMIINNLAMHRDEALRGVRRPHKGVHHPRRRRRAVLKLHVCALSLNGLLTGKRLAQVTLCKGRGKGLLDRRRV